MAWEWVAPAVTGVVGVVGVAGTLTVGVITVGAQNRREARSQRAAAYEAFLAALDVVNVTMAQRIGINGAAPSATSAGGDHQAAWTAKLRAADQERVEVLVALTNAKTRLEMVAPAQVVSGARQVLKLAVNRVESSRTATEIQQLSGNEIGDFLAAARADLQIDKRRWSARADYVRTNELP